MYLTAIVMLAHFISFISSYKIVVVTIKTLCALKFMAITLYQFQFFELILLVALKDTLKLSGVVKFIKEILK